MRSLSSCLKREKKKAQKTKNLTQAPEGGPTLMATRFLKSVLKKKGGKETIRGGGEETIAYVTFSWEKKEKQKNATTKQLLSILTANETAKVRKGKGSRGGGIKKKKRVFQLTREEG